MARSTEETSKGNAVQRIAEARKLRGPNLKLDKLPELVTLPEELVELDHVRLLDLSGTNITDFSLLAKMKSLRILRLKGCPIKDFSPLWDMPELTSLDLSNTTFSNLAPVARMANLELLDISNTEVLSLEDISDLAKLQRIRITKTDIADLRPIMNLPFDKSGTLTGLSYRGSVAASILEREFEKFSDAYIVAKDQAKELKTFLRSLPPYPEPLPWDVVPSRPDTPPTDPIPRILIASERVDLDHSTATGDDQNDPIKKRLYARLPDEAKSLTRHTNRYPEADGPARALSKHVDVPFEEADMLDIHLEIAALTDLVALDATKPDAEQMDADCIAAINAVTRIGVPITMDNPDVLLFEKRSVEYARTRRAKAQADAEAAITAGLAKDKDLATQRARDTSELISTAPADGRVADYRSSFTRNVVIAAATIMGALGDAAIGHVSGAAVTTAAEFILLHQQAILSTAPSWGESGFAWAQYVINRAQQIIDDARRN